MIQEVVAAELQTSIEIDAWQDTAKDTKTNNETYCKVGDEHLGIERNWLLPCVNRKIAFATSTVQEGLVNTYHQNESDEV